MMTIDIIKLELYEKIQLISVNHIYTVDSILETFYAKLLSNVQRITVKY